VEVFDAARALKIRDLSQMTEKFVEVLLNDHNLWSTVAATKDTPSAIFDIAWTKLATRFVELSKTEEFCHVTLEDLLWFLRSEELVVTVSEPHKLSLHLLFQATLHLQFVNEIGWRFVGIFFFL
jgi:hypothetical protein